MTVPLCCVGGVASWEIPAQIFVEAPYFMLLFLEYVLRVNQSRPKPSSSPATGLGTPPGSPSPSPSFPTSPSANPYGLRFNPWNTLLDLLLAPRMLKQWGSGAVPSMAGSRGTAGTQPPSGPLAERCAPEEGGVEVWESDTEVAIRHGRALEVLRSPEAGFDPEHAMMAVQVARPPPPPTPPSLFASSLCFLAEGKSKGRHPQVTGKKREKGGGYAKA